MKRLIYTKNQLIGNVKFIKDKEYISSPDGQQRRMAEFKCICGTNFVTYIDAVKRGLTTSCGCYQKKRASETSITHGDSIKQAEFNYLYRTWTSINRRCYTESSTNYKLWGGRGIEVYEKWRTNYPLFKKYILTNLELRKKGQSIDRIKNDGNYEPGNIRWATPYQQAMNSKTAKLSLAAVISIKCLLNTRSISQVKISKLIGVSFSTISLIKRNKIHKTVRL